MANNSYSNNNKHNNGTIKIRIKAAKVTTPGMPSEASEESMRKAVQKAIDMQIQNGHPVARYDFALKKPYFEYPDGSKKYE